MIFGKALLIIANTFSVIFTETSFDALSAIIMFDQYKFCKPSNDGKNKCINFGNDLLAIVSSKSLFSDAIYSSTKKSSM